MSVLVTSHLALFTAILAVCGFFGLGRMIVNSQDSETSIIGDFLALIFSGVLLSLRTWFEWRWLTWVIWILLISGAFMTLGYGIPELRNIWRQRTVGQNWRFNGLFLGLILLLYLEWLWVALPLYRYDQWTYHLVVAKWVDLLGFMKGPLAVDHIFFTGSYEFLGLLPRAIWQDDAFQQGFQNCLTSILIAGIAGKVSFNTLRGGFYTERQALALSLAFMAMALFSSGDHEGLSSAKPDFLLMMVAFLLLWIFVSKSQKKDPKSPWFIIGVLMGACLALKINWIHLALALLPVAMWSAWEESRIQGLVKLCAGGLIGITASGPFLLKNYLFFGNPLHPAQTPLWKSNIWSDGLASYWRFILNKPDTPIEFVNNILNIILESPLRMSGALLVIVSVIVMAAISKSSVFKSKIALSWTKLLLFYGLYIFFWGFFYGHGIAHRFVSGLPAIGLVLSLATIKMTKMRTNAAVIALLVPFFWGGEIEVTSARITSAWDQDIQSYQSTLSKSPEALNEDLRIIAAHKKRILGPAAQYDHGQIVSDSIWNFYGPSIFFDATAPVTRTLMEQVGLDPDHDCARSFLAARDIRYVWLKETASLPNWPQSIISLLAFAEEIPTKHGKLWYLGDPTKLNCQSNNTETQND